MVQVQNINFLLNFHKDTEDYFGDSGTLTFDAENTTQDVVVFLQNDQVFEPTETFFVDLTQPDGTLCDTAIVFIQDNDQPPTIIRTLIECTNTVHVASFNFIQQNMTYVYTYYWKHKFIT